MEKGKRKVISVSSAFGQTCLGATVRGDIWFPSFGAWILVLSAISWIVDMEIGMMVLIILFNTTEYHRHPAQQFRVREIVNSLKLLDRK